MLDLDLLTTSYHEKFLMIGNVQTDVLAIGKLFACEQSSHERDRSDFNSSWKRRFILVSTHSRFDHQRRSLSILTNIVWYNQSIQLRLKNSRVDIVSAFIGV